MRPTLLIAGIRVFTLVALATSTALLVDYSGIEVPFCAQAGCLAVRRHGYLAGVPVPLLGMGAFGAVYVVSLLVKLPGMLRLLYSLNVTGGLFGLGLILYQALKIGTFCLPCVIVDVTALLAGAAGAVGFASERARHRALATRSDAEPDRQQGHFDPLRTWGWIALGVLAVLVPLLWSPLRSAPPVPEAVRARYQPGKINVVEFTDFECSHCRALHPRLLTLLADYPGQVHHVRLNAPLSGHAHARGAARAAICAEAQGEGNRMAETLFRVEALAPPDLLVYARSLGLDMGVFESCLSDPATDRRIDDEIAALMDSGLFVTPTTFVGPRRIPGAQPDEVFRAALEEAKHGEGNRGLSVPVYSALVLALLILVIYFSRRPSPSRPRTA